MKQDEFDALLAYLKQKKEILRKIEEVTAAQNALLAAETVNDNLFDSLMDEIDLYREELDKLEEGGSVLVGNINPTDLTEAEKETLADIMKTIEKSSVAILEMNSQIEKKAGEYLVSQRKDILGQRKSVEGIRGYFKSMGGLNEDSTFMDNKI